jgi:hypothetical protein
LEKSGDIPWLAKKDALDKDLDRAISKGLTDYKLNTNKIIALQRMQKDMTAHPRQRQKGGYRRKKLTAKPYNPHCHLVFSLGRRSGVWFLSSANAAPRTRRSL